MTSIAVVDERESVEGGKAVAKCMGESGRERVVRSTQTQCRSSCADLIRTVIMTAIIIFISKVFIIALDVVVL